MDLSSLGLVEWLTVGAAALGAVLGVLNMWRDIRQDRVKLRVSFRPVQSSERSIGGVVTVTNLSSFPVAIDEVYAVVRGQSDLRFPRSYSKNFDALEPRRSRSTSFEISGKTRNAAMFAQARRCYVKTECGKRVTVRGLSRHLQDELYMLKRSLPEDQRWLPVWLTWTGTAREGRTPPTPTAPAPWPAVRREH